jgi:excisionase family DNA binding protein
LVTAGRRRTRSQEVSMRDTNTQAEILKPTIRRTDGWSPIPERAKHRGRQGSSSAAEEDMQRLLLTVSEAARKLGIGRSLLYELMANNEVESIHVGRLCRIPADALVTYIDRQRNAHAANAD